MSKKITAAFAALSFMASYGVAFAAPLPKVTICHNTGSDSNPVFEITVSENALSAFLAEGDFVVDESHPCTTGGPTPE